jgi:hypothetical protein
VSLFSFFVGFLRNALSPVSSAVVAGGRLSPVRGLRRRRIWRQQERRNHELMVDSQKLSIFQIESSMLFGSMCMMEIVTLHEKNVSMSTLRRPPVPDAAVVGS